MLSIQFPDYDFKVRVYNNQRQIFDPVRKKFVKITPEEWVRQNWIYYLNDALKFPLSLLSVEKGLELNGLQKRCDIVAYDKSGKPFLIVECKAPEVKITQDTLDQASRYNLKLQVPFLLVSNGNQSAFFRVEQKKGTFHEMQKIPLYDELLELWKNS